jgi:chlorite dismutase
MAVFFSIFSFLKLSNSFKHLESNEKTVLKQEFEDWIAHCQEKIFLRTYFVSSLKEDCDILMWRMHSSIDYLQKICTTMMGTGIGKYMEIKYSYIGMKNFKTDNLDELNKRAGIHTYLLLHPLNKSYEWYEMEEKEREKLITEREEILKEYPDIIENFFASFGIDDQDMIVTRESPKIETLIDATKKLKTMKTKSYTVSDKPVFLCIGKDLREILDTLS